MRKATRSGHRKSRLGCSSCKRLRIKCDEKKPACEYCTATNRKCVYLAVPPRKGKDDQVAVIAASQVIMNPSNGLSPLSNLSEQQCRTLDFFVSTGACACALGNPTIAGMWRTNGIQLALQSDGVLNGLMALGSRIMTRYRLLPDHKQANEYFNKTVRLFRTNIARDRKYHCPEELALSTYLIWAFSLADSELVPVVSYNGGVDLLGIAQGTTAVFSTYYEVLSQSFTKVVMIRSMVDNIQGLSAVHAKNVLNFLEETIDSYFEQQLFDFEEAKQYYEVVMLMGKLCHLAESSQSLYPLVDLLGGLRSEFIDLVRQAYPMAVVLVCYVCAILRRCLFSHRRGLNTWDRFILNAYELIPPQMENLLDQAFKISRGLAFVEDLEPLIGLAWAPNEK
jgi:hypothetical protein